MLFDLKGHKKPLLCLYIVYNIIFFFHILSECPNVKHKCYLSFFKDWALMSSWPFKILRVAQSVHYISHLSHEQTFYFSINSPLHDTNPFFGDPRFMLNFSVFLITILQRICTYL